MYEDYIGIPFAYGGRTKEQLDCYGLVMLLYKDIHGITLPDFDSPTNMKDIHTLVAGERPKWETGNLEVGSILLFSVMGYGSHVGYYIGNDKFIHTWEATSGVTIERLGISWKHRLIGIYDGKRTCSN